MYNGDIIFTKDRLCKKSSRYRTHQFSYVAFDEIKVKANVKYYIRGFVSSRGEEVYKLYAEHPDNGKRRHNIPRVYMSRGKVRLYFEKGIIKPVRY